MDCPLGILYFPGNQWPIVGKRNNKPGSKKSVQNCNRWHKSNSIPVIMNEHNNNRTYTKRAQNVREPEIQCFY